VSTQGAVALSTRCSSIDSLSDTGASCRQTHVRTAWTNTPTAEAIGNQPYVDVFMRARTASFKYYQCNTLISAGAEALCRRSQQAAKHARVLPVRTADMQATLRGALVQHTKTDDAPSGPHNPSATSSCRRYTR
jgi:hypothetical protein